ncbi:hypothetical protein ACE6H2_005132 [Prunus campanulata]
MEGEEEAIAIQTLLDLINVDLDLENYERFVERCEQRQVIQAVVERRKHLGHNDPGEVTATPRSLRPSVKRIRDPPPITSNQALTSINFIPFSSNTKRKISKETKTLTQVFESPKSLPEPSSN